MNQPVSCSVAPARGVCCAAYRPAQTSLVMLGVLLQLLVVRLVWSLSSLCLPSFSSLY